MHRELQNSSTEENNIYTTGEAAAAAAAATTTNAASSSSRQNRRTHCNDSSLLVENGERWFCSLVSPTAGTTDRRHSHFNRLSSVNNQSLASNTQNSDDEEEENDDNESVSTQSTQPISLTSFIPHPTTITTNDYHPGVNSSLRQTRQRLNITENSSSSQPRTRYSTRSSTTHRNHDDNYDIRPNQQQHIQTSSSRILSASDDDDDDHDISSNNKRNRIERSDRRITSINRPNYKIDSDEHDDEDDQQAMNTTNDNHNDNQSTEKIHEKDKSKFIEQSFDRSIEFSFFRRER